MCIRSFQPVKRLQQLGSTLTLLLSLLIVPGAPATAQYAVLAWGAGAEYQLGDGTNTNHAEPIVIKGPGGTWGFLDAVAIEEAGTTAWQYATAGRYGSGAM
jgi:hypothetical protein